MGQDSTVSVSASGLRAQSLRMRIIAENLANQSSVATTPGGAPYRRRIPTFKAEVDRASGATTVKVGGVATPNVNGLVEMADMKAAQRSYEANLNAIEAARGMTMRTIDLLK
jgi:flagellar basal-body rod protein FlgC